MSAISSYSAGISTSCTTTYKSGSKTVVEHNYSLPKGQHSNLVGSFSYRIPTMKADKLRTQVAVQKRKLQEIEAKERTTLVRTPKKKACVRARIRYLETQLTHEMASQTEVRINVSEQDD